MPQDDDDSYPMVPQHPRWDERSESTVRWSRAAALVLAVLSVAAATVVAWRVLG